MATTNPLTEQVRAFASGSLKKADIQAARHYICLDIERRESIAKATTEGRAKAAAKRKAEALKQAKELVEREGGKEND